MRALAASGSPSFTRSTFNSARYRSHSFGGRPLPCHGVAGAEIDPLDRRRRHVDVVRTVQVVPVLAAQEAVAFRQHLEHGFADECLRRIEQTTLGPTWK